jgi:hypothetical protein
MSYCKPAEGSVGLSYRFRKGSLTMTGSNWIALLERKSCFLLKGCPGLVGEALSILLRAASALRCLDRFSCSTKANFLWLRCWAARSFG